MLTLQPSPAPVPAILDPNFNQAVNVNDTTAAVSSKQEKVYFSQADLQRLRVIVRNEIQVTADYRAVTRKLAHVYHEASDSDNPKATAKYFENHSFYRNAFVESSRTLRNLERIQRSIRNQIRGA
jgi:hypothetical protein